MKSDLEKGLKDATTKAINSTALMNDWDLVQTWVSVSQQGHHDISDNVMAQIPVLCVKMLNQCDLSLFSLNNLFQFQCCGVHNKTDWKKNVPLSCCQSNCTSNRQDWEMVNKM